MLPEESLGNMMNLRHFAIVGDKAIVRLRVATPLASRMAIHYSLDTLACLNAGL